MRRAIFLSCFVVLSVFGQGCQQNSQELNALKAENASLKKENADLKKKYEDAVFGASRLLVQAEEQFKAEKYGDVKATAALLLEKHPSSAEAVRAKALLADAGARIERQSREVSEKERKRLDSATSKMRKNVDTVEGITWYHDKTTSEYVDKNSFHIYMGTKAGAKPWLRLVARYSDDDWLFVKSFMVVSDGNRFESGPVEFKRDNGSGSIWEWYDTSLTAKELQWVQSVVNGKKTLIRYEGDKYYEDREISGQERQALQNVLDAFAVLGGILPK